VMPGPVGPNPSLTIAALADRFADAMLQGAPASATRRAVQAGSADGAPAAHPAATPAAGAVSLSFTEEMKGFCAFDETDYERGNRLGKERGQSLMFHLTITSSDIQRFIA